MNEYSPFNPIMLTLFQQVECVSC